MNFLGLVQMLKERYSCSGAQLPEWILMNYLCWRNIIVGYCYFIVVEEWSGVCRRVGEVKVE